MEKNSRQTIVRRRTAKVHDQPDDRRMEFYPRLIETRKYEGCGPVEVDLVTCPSMVNRTVSNLKDRAGLAKVYGLDCEWTIIREKGVAAVPELLQLATPLGYCALIRLNMLNDVPAQVKEFLEDPQYIKVGIGVLDDVVKLKESFGVTTSSVLDVRFLADDAGYDPRGLKLMSKSILGIEDCQNKHYSFHYWRGQLSETQIKYAADDAINSVRMFHRLNHTTITQQWPEWESWSAEEYHRRTAELWNRYYGLQFEYSRSKYFVKHLVALMQRLSCVEVKIPVPKIGFTPNNSDQKSIQLK